MADETAPMVPLNFERYDDDVMGARADAFLADVRTRRSVRHFSDAPIPLDVVRTCIAAAGRAPSGANKQPWTFVLVTCPETKRRIREAAEEEERAFYEHRAPDRWLKDLEHLDTNAHKPFLETAPALIVAFAQRSGPPGEDGEAEQHYYVQESMGLACGFLIAALHHAGLATLTHTPSPMGFLKEVLGRPEHERPFLLLPVGYPVDGCEVPDIDKKPLDAIVVEVAGDGA